MYQLNPLLESFGDVLKRAETLSPKNKRRYLRHYLTSRFGGSNIDELADNYGKRLLVGSGKKIRNLAKKSGRKVSLIRVQDPLDSRIQIRGAIQNINSSSYNNLGKRNLNKGKDIVLIPRHNSHSKNNKPSTIFNANQAAHESDEYQTLINRALKNKSDVDFEAIRDIKTRIGLPKQYSHYRGNVLTKEKARNDLQDTVFGSKRVPKIQRNSDEIKETGKDIIQAEKELKDRLKNNKDYQDQYDKLTNLYLSFDNIRHFMT